MNKTLWEKVLAFSFDQPNDQYGFSTRLALENHWTIHFTQSAIIEYKKFLFLAATNNEMVSPSEIVDIVWHQHLIFTNSYSDFCDLLGKRIEHIPSTHNRSEFDKFKMAKEMSGDKKATATKTIKKILISQARPESEKSPYFDLERKYNVTLFFKPFIELEPIGAKEFRKTKPPKNNT